MKKNMPIWTTVAGAVLSLAVLAGTGSAGTDVSVNINLGPPPVVIAEPPEMVVVPQTMVYFAPGISTDLFFTAGFWWRPHDGRWFRAAAYGGPWVVVGFSHVPVEVVRLPRNYRTVYRHGKPIPYGQLKKHYAYREREREEHRGDWGDPGHRHPKDGKYEEHGKHSRGNGKGHSKHHD